MANITITTDGTPAGTKIELNGKRIDEEEGMTLASAYFSYSTWSDKPTVDVSFTMNEKQPNGLIKKISFEIAKGEEKKDSVIAHVPSELFKTDADEAAFVVTGDLPEYLRVS